MDSSETVQNLHVASSIETPPELIGIVRSWGHYPWLWCWRREFRRHTCQSKRILNQENPKLDVSVFMRKKQRHNYHTRMSSTPGWSEAINVVLNRFISAGDSLNKNIPPVPGGWPGWPGWRL